MAHVHLFGNVATTNWSWLKSREQMLKTVFFFFFISPTMVVTNGAAAAAVAGELRSHALF